MSAQEIIETFALLPDWEDRYAYLIELGDRLPSFPEQDKIDPNKVIGCMSNVWLTVRKQAGGYDIRATSDAAIVRGLIAVVLSVVQGADRETILQTDITDLFTRLGLAEHLSPNRQNGFFAMWRTLQNQVAADRATSQSGRTLVETLAVLGIIAVIAIAALKGFSEINLRQKTDLVYKELQERATLATARAVRAKWFSGKHEIFLGLKAPESGVHYDIECCRGGRLYVRLSDVPDRVEERLRDMDYSRMNATFSHRVGERPFLEINLRNIY